MVVGQTVDGTAVTSLGVGANDTLGTIISALNAQVSGRPVFAGSSLGAVPLAGADQVMAAARTAVSGSVDAAGVRAALDIFFDTAGGGFETLIYQGGTADMSAYRLGEGEEVSLSIRADDPNVRSILKDTVMAALAADDTLALNAGERVSLIRESGASMMAGLDRLTGLRANLGFAEERIDQSISRNAAEQSSLRMARGDLLSVDLFETASALEQAQQRLETIYTLTARSARLNLLNFL
jgi:flagellar hook-associated protein 3 FlgL